MCDRLIALCNEHGDMLHLMGAYLHRAQIRSMQRDRAGLAHDFGEIITLARKLGHGTMEWMATFNLGENLYWIGDAAAAEPHVLRAIAIDDERRSAAGQPVSRLLEARLRLFRGQEALARALCAEIRAQQARSREANDADALLSPSGEVLLETVELGVREASEAAWGALEARAESCSVWPEIIEVLELHALTALRRGHAAEARAARDRALAVAARIPHPMDERLSRLSTAIEYA